MYIAFLISIMFSVLKMTCQLIVSGYKLSIPDMPEVLALMPTAHGGEQTWETMNMLLLLDASPFLVSYAYYCALHLFDIFSCMSTS